MDIKDNRQFINTAEATGDVVRIKEEVDWDNEAGALTRLTCEKRGPALLFEKIKDYSEEYRMMGAPLATFRRVAIAMGLKPDTAMQDLFQEYEKRTHHPLKPITVKSAPCQEKVLKGKDLDVFKLPVPYIHEGDGGRYIGSWHMVIVRDPDSDWVNWGMYRMMVHNRKNIGGYWHIGTDAGKILMTKFIQKGKIMPVSIAVGADPISCLAATAPLKSGESEVDYAGGLHQEPVELVKSLTNDILVPAQAEIILEGEILPDTKMQEGPFGEYTGYRTPGYYPRVCRLTAITHRNNPILTFTNMGMPVDDSGICWSMTTSAEISRHLKEYGLPVTGVFSPPETGNMLIIVRIRTLYGNIAHVVKNIISAIEPGMPKVMVVDDDVDIYNLNEVWHAFAAKCHPARGIRIQEPDLVNPLIPFLSTEERNHVKGASMLMDCTWPTDWPKSTDVPPRISFRETYNKDTQESALAKWKKLGIKQD